MDSSIARERNILEKSGNKLLSDEALKNDELKENVLKCVDEHILLGLLKGILRIPSFPAEETEVAKYITEWMEKRGIEVDMQEVEDGRFQAIGRIRGTGEGPVLVYNGHTDIDAQFEGPKENPFEPIILEIDGERRIYGQGLYNMKGGVACLLVAGDAIKRAAIEYGIKLKGELILATTVGETQGGTGTWHLLRTYFPKHGIWPDMAVIAEPQGHRITTVHAGNVGIQINVYGESWKIGAKEKGVDALEKMLKVIEALKKDFKFTYRPVPYYPEGPKFLISTIVGGRRRVMMKAPGHYFDLRSGCYSCDQCTIVIDVRFIHGMAPDGIREDFERVLRKLKEKDPELDYEVKTPVDKKFETHRLPAWPLDVPTTEYMVQAIKQAYNYVWGKDPSPIGTAIPAMYGYEDCGHFWKAGIPACSHGPLREQKTLPEPYADMFHRRPSYARSYITLEELLRVSKVYTLTALDILTKTKKEVKKGRTRMVQVR